MLSPEGRAAIFQLVEALLTSQPFVGLLVKQYFQAYILYKLYGIRGIPLILFANKTTWSLEAQVLGETNSLGEIIDKNATAFKESVIAECTMIAVAAAIVAQIAITGLSLSDLSRAHWAARGFFVLSLTTSLMAVYCSCTQQRTLGRLFDAKQVRLWIRGGNHQVDILSGLRKSYQIRAPTRLERNNGSSAERLIDMLIAALSEPYTEIHSEAKDFRPDPGNTSDFKEEVIAQCFMPSPSAVLTVSAPQMLLLTSLISLLAGFGTYFGYVWIRNLDDVAGQKDSRKIFITYIVSLAVSSLVYSISQAYQDQYKRSESRIMDDYLVDFVRRNPTILKTWNADIDVASWEMKLIPRRPRVL